MTYNRPMQPQNLNSLFKEHYEQIEQWFELEWQRCPPLFYGSLDLRDAGFKIAPVDTNLFPAGFNNLAPDCFKRAAVAVQNYLNHYYPQQTKLLVIPENHTRNQFYAENIKKLVDILNLAGIETRLGTLSPETMSESSLPVETLIRAENKIGVANFFPELILLNNDLSAGTPSILENLEQVILPPLSLGWQNRLKSTHFKYYAEICQGFAQYLKFDPWLITPLFDHCNEIDFLKRKGEGCLAVRAEKLLFQIEQKYMAYGIQEDPFLIVKADSGTYGMGVMTIKEPQELLQLNRKQRTKMSASKDGQEVHAAIIQEGIPTIARWNQNITAEPVIYGIGSEIVGGFYRTHETKDATESLNAPGMRFYPFDFKEVSNSYSYEVVARLALLAAAHEKQGE